jgi:hypothetical protein
MNRAYRNAVICGAVPLIVGVSVFLLWLVTRWDQLMMAGVATLYAGSFMLLVGVLELARYGWLGLKTPEFPHRKLRRTALGAAALLLLNPPVAAGLVYTAVFIETLYTVVVDNQTQRPLTGVRIFGSGNCDESIGTIAPGGKARRSFQIECEGALNFNATGGSTIYTGIIDGYVTSNMGGHTVVTVNADGTLTFDQGSP